MRWYALDVDFEMYGKDLIESAILSSKIIKLIGKNNPSGFAYELFLDEKGEKISKSKGNGITIDQWLEYASPPLWPSGTTITPVIRAIYINRSEVSMVGPYTVVLL